jgi:hypothetical protein
MAKIQKGDTYYNAIKQMMDREGIPEYVWWPIVLQESGGRINAVGDNGTSFGIFQIHGNFSEAEKKRLTTDPVYNAQKALALWKARPVDPWQFASSKAQYPSPEFVAYFWISAQRPAAWTQYQRTNTITPDMQRIMRIAGGDEGLNSDVNAGIQPVASTGNVIADAFLKAIDWMFGWFFDWVSENKLNIIIVAIAIPAIILLIYSMVKGD